MVKVTLSFLLIVLALSPANAADMTDWQSAHDRGHPLAGSVWRGDGTPAGFDTLANRAAAADFVLIGEIHPNPDHHVIQASLLSSMVEAGRRPAVVFEMIPMRYQEALENFLATGDGDASRLGALVDWEKRGWPDWRIYQPIAAAALDNGLELAAGDLDRTAMRSIAKSGAAALTEADRARFGLDAPLPAAASAELRDVLRESHCNLLPDSALDGMMAVQRARDGSMAAALIDSGNDGGAVLITGGGHARKDFGVPEVLSRLSPDRSVLSISIIEVDTGSADFAAYAYADGTLPFDFVMFTPRFENKDHCAELRKAFGKDHK
jgi:uncharacterized iron-regulated protein